MCLGSGLDLYLHFASAVCWLRSCSSTKYIRIHSIETIEKTFSHLLLMQIHANTAEHPFDCNMPHQRREPASVYAHVMYLNTFTRR